MGGHAWSLISHTVRKNADSPHHRLANFKLGEISAESKNARYKKHRWMNPTFTLP